MFKVLSRVSQRSLPLLSSKKLVFLSGGGVCRGSQEKDPAMAAYEIHESKLVETTGLSRSVLSMLSSDEQAISRVPG